VAVVEINSPDEIKSAAVTDFVLFDEAESVTKLKRVIAVERFHGHHVAGEGIFAYYLNPAFGDGTTDWNKVLPAGKIQLRIRVALLAAPGNPKHFQLTIGPYALKGEVDGEWPT
jgi:hypothetical protein